LVCGFKGYQTGWRWPIRRLETCRINMACTPEKNSLSNLPLSFEKYTAIPITFRPHR